MDTSTSCKSFSLYYNLLRHSRVTISMEFPVSTSTRRIMAVAIFNCITNTSLWGICRGCMSFGPTIMIGPTSGFNHLATITWLSCRIWAILYQTFNFSLLSHEWLSLLSISLSHHSPLSLSHIGCNRLPFLTSRNNLVAPSRPTHEGPFELYALRSIMPEICILFTIVVLLSKISWSFYALWLPLISDKCCIFMD